MGSRLEPPDEVLVLAAILGDVEAFGELADRYGAAAVRVAQAVVGRDDAEDVAQEALLLAFKALPAIENPAKFPAWLGAITRNRALRWARREGARKAASVELDELLVERLASLARPLAADDGRHEELGRALAEIPPDYALVLRLRYFDEMPLDRIAAFLGVPLSTVKWRVHRGKALVRERLEYLRAADEVSLDEESVGSGT
jgi:RNA polymerase sigma-70 factor, ECF subfamily